MESTINRRPASRLSVLDQAFDLSRVDWGVVYFVVLMVIVVGTRFWDLGSRALHHDESIHAYYSYQFLNGNPWKYDPAYHGPFLYAIVALGFGLFGATDATTRIMPALFGTILIAMCWLLRPYIGRLGAIAAATIVTFSPSIMYYSRSLRHDMFATVGTFMLFLAILGFLRTHEGKFLYLGAVGLGIAVASHELIYINLGIFGLFLIIVWGILRGLGAPGDPDRRMEVDPVTSALRAIPQQRWAALGALGVLVGIYVVFYTNLMTDISGLDGIIRGFAYWLDQHHVARGDQPIWYYALLLAPIYEPLALFTSIGFLIALAVRTFQGSGGLPADIPLADYPGRALDERRPSGRGRNTDMRGSAALADGVDPFGLSLPSASVMAGFTVAFLAFWGFGALVAYSIAGEKMPWLLMQIALPFALLAGAAVGRLLGRTDWGFAFREGGYLMGIILVLLLFAGQAFLTALGGFFNPPAGSTAGQELLKTVILGAFVGLMLGGVYWQITRMGGRIAWRVAALTLLLVLFAYEVRSSVMSSFRNGATPIEMLVYTQSAPDVPEVAQRIERLGRDQTAFTNRNTGDVQGGHGLDIALDSTVEWPFDWYWRDQQKITRFTPPTQVTVAQNAAVIIASIDAKNNSAFQQQVQGKYREEHYKLRWWFPEDDYKNPNFPGTFVADLFNPASWSVNSRVGKYLLYRDPGAPLGSTDFYLYVRNDLVSLVGSPVGSGSTVAPGSTTPPQNNSGTTYKLFDMAPQGTGNGQFNQPRGIAISPVDGSYYVVDATNMRVQKFDKDGKFVKAFGSEGSDAGQFIGLNINGSRVPGTGPGGVAVDKAGNVYVADTWNHRVQKFDKDGTFLLQWGSFLDMNPPPAGTPVPAVPPDANVKFYGPRAIAIDSAGAIYVTDTGNKRVLVFDANGQPLRQIADGAGPNAGLSNGPKQLNEPMGIAIDSTDTVYVADTFNQRINVFDKMGTPLRRWAIDGWSRDAAFLEPQLAIDGSNNLYASDPAKQTVYKFSADGKLLGSKNTAGTVTLVRPTGLTATKDGTVIVVDTDKNGVLQLGKIP
ncbi:MAG TPA: flippase activity-associated protein Agl23 [Chloroflexia bacterium]|nr:flippase activity-associated protein Agl23 [Chloroflexia bacterium]